MRLMDDPHLADPLTPKYQRVILKLSGESFTSSGKSGINIDETLNIAHQAKRVHARGVQLAIVIGAGNILRGAQFSAGGAVIKEATAHYMGMLATVLNGMALQSALESIHCETRLMTALRMETVAEPFIQRRALRHLEKGRIVILAGGTGNPFVTTDTAAALRARELGADILLKATKVDGVYSADPKTDPSAKRFERLTHQEAFDRNLKVLDATAFALARDTRMPIIVFSIHEPGAVAAVLAGKGRATIVE